jgi:hypothetical protein
MAKKYIELPEYFRKAIEEAYEEVPYQEGEDLRRGMQRLAIAQKKIGEHEEGLMWHGYKTDEEWVKNTGRY